MRYLSTAIIAAFLTMGTATATNAQWFKDEKPKAVQKAVPKRPITRPIPTAVPKSNSETAAKSERPLDISKHETPESLVNPFIVLYTERGEIASCKPVYGSIRLHGIPRQPMLFEQDCLETGKAGLVQVCKKYVFKEVTQHPTTSTSMVSFWDNTNMYRVWSGPFALYNKVVEIPQCK